MNSKLISVIVPVYNAEEYLYELLTDLKEQTYKMLEILIIDDGSTDKSWEVIQYFIQHDTRMQAIKTNNVGVSKARNVGLNIAKGEFIRFVDADDRVPLNSLEKMIDLYEKYQDIDLVIGNYLSIPAKGYYTGNFLKNGVVLQKEFVELFLRKLKSFYFGVPWNKLYKRKLIDDYKIRFDEKLFWCEDFLFNLEYYKHMKSCYILSVKEGIYCYYQRENGITATLKDKDIKEIEEVEKKRVKEAKAFFKLFGKEKEFELEWKYSNLYAKLSIMTKKGENKDIVKRYLSFKKVLQSEEAYKYICLKVGEPHNFVWKMLRATIKEEKYIIPFVFFGIKGYFTTKFSKGAILIKKVIQPFVPKDL